MTKIQDLITDDFTLDDFRELAVERLVLAVSEELSFLDPRWRPMETAPDDGTIFEIPTEDDDIALCRWNPEHAAGKAKCGPGWEWRTAYEAMTQNGWMELSAGFGAWRPAHPDWNREGER